MLADDMLDVPVLSTLNNDEDSDLKRDVKL